MNFDHVLGGAFQFAFHTAPNAFCCTQRRCLLHTDFAEPVHKLHGILFRGIFRIGRNNAIAYDEFAHAHQRRQSAGLGLNRRRVVLFTGVRHHFPHHLDRHFAVTAVTAAPAFEAVIHVLHGQILREESDAEIVVIIVRIDEMRFATAEPKHERSPVIDVIHRSAVGIDDTRSAFLFHFKDLNSVQRSRNGVDTVHPKLHARELRNESPGIDKHVRFFSRDGVHQFDRPVVRFREHPVVEHDHQDRKQ